MDIQFTKGLQDNYNRIVNYFGNQFKVGVMISLASKYTLEKREFSGVALQKIVDQMAAYSKKSLSIQRNSPIPYYIAARFLGQDLETCFESLLQRDTALKEAGFHTSPFRLAGAMMLDEDIHLHTKRAKALYDEMHRKQFFLTAKEDIPYVVLLSKENEHPQRQVETMVQYYKGLRKQGFMLGNALQSLAQILTMYSSEYNDMLLQYVVELRHSLNHKGIKIKPLHYPYLGILALNATDHIKIGEIAEWQKTFMELKMFRMAKEFALIVAIQKVIKELVEVQNMVDMKENLFIENLIDALDIALDVLDFFVLPGSVGDLFDFFR